MNTRTVLRNSLLLVGDRVRDRSIRWGVVSLLLLLIVQGLFSIRRKDVTIEEMMDIATGYYHLRTGSFQMDPLQPPLMRMISAAPLLFLNPALHKIDGEVKNWSLSQQAMYASSFLYDNRVDTDQMLFVTRLPVLGIAVLAGVYLFLWIRGLYGDKTGLLALLVYVLGCTILEPASLTANDFGYGAFLFIAAYYFWRNSRDPSFSTLLSCGVAFGAALLTKVTAILLTPIAAIFAAIFLWRGRFGAWEHVRFIQQIDSSRILAKRATSAGISFAALSIGVVGALNAGYLFEGSFGRLGLYDLRPEIHKVLPTGSLVSSLIGDFYLNTPVPFPRPFVEQIKHERHNITAMRPYLASLDEVPRFREGYRYLADSQLDWRHDLVYRVVNGYELKVDVYMPREKTKRPYPTMIYFHGGGWQGGSKDASFFSVVPYLARGMAVVNVDYRLAQVSPAPAAMEDCRCSLRWVFDNAERYGFDVSRVAVTGPSAGGHLALMTGILDSSAGYDHECTSGPPLKVRAIVNFFGVVDVGDLLKGPHRHNSAVRWLSGLPNPEAAAHKASSLSYMHVGLPPVLTIHGDSDPIVPYEQALRLHRALDEKRVPNELLTIRGGKHGNFNAQETLQIDERIEAFLKKYGVLPDT